MAKKKGISFKKTLQGADDIYLTDKFIAVTRVKTIYDKYGGGTLTKKRKYVPRTQRTMGILNSEMGKVGEVKIMAKGKEYTNAQKIAFKTGKAYRLGRDNKVIIFKIEENKQSFQDGYRAGGKTKHKKIGE